jgi:hypothetical protein
MDDASIRALVGWRVKHGRLPSSEPLHFWAAHGHGAFCAGCGSVIEPSEIEYELEWSNPSRTVHMHSRCYEIWHEQRPQTSKPAITVAPQNIGTRPSWW